MRNELIKEALRDQFKSGTSKMAKRICFGYEQDEYGNLVINPKEAEIVRWMFKRYLSGYSLGKIANELYQKGIKSPTGKERWNREAIDKLLSNEKIYWVSSFAKDPFFYGYSI